MHFVLSGFPRFFPFLIKILIITRASKMYDQKKAKALEIPFVLR